MARIVHEYNGKLQRVSAMAAQDDDKVSENRRRLFKALSAAPVVMTLRPGEVLANSSGIQCAANPMPAATVKFYKNTTALCTNETTGVGCHAFEVRDFWDPGIRSGTPGNSKCAFWEDKFVVKTSATTYWVVVNPNESGAGVRGDRLFLKSMAEPNSAVLDESSGVMTFYGTADGTSGRIEQCAAVTSREGLFLAVGGATFDGDVPNGWESHGVWPELLDDENNVLGGSCLTSFTSTNGFILADG